MKESTDMDFTVTYDQVPEAPAQNSEESGLVRGEDAEEEPET